jgi:GT2 family glycosyltransferase
VLNWNRRDDTLDCLRSLEAVEYPNLDVIVVDNGSEDGSIEAIRAAHPAVAVIATGANLGFAGGNNVGMRAALERRADYLLLLNNDTIVAPDVVHQLVQAARAVGDPAIFAAKIYFLAEPRRIWAVGSRWRVEESRFELVGYQVVDTGHEYEEIAETEAAIGCAMFFPADMLATVGFLDSRYFLLYEDSDWCFRGKSAGYRCLMVPKAHVWHKVSATIGGSDSPLPRYFTTRNRLLWAERHLPLGQRLRVWLTTLAEMLEPWSAALEVVSLALGRRNLRQAYWASRGLPKEFARFRGSAHRRGLRDAYRLGVWHYMLRRFGDCPTHLRRPAPASSRPATPPPH